MKINLVVYEWEGLVAEYDPELYLCGDEERMYKNISNFLSEDGDVVQIKNDDDLRDWKDEQEGGDYKKYVYVFELKAPVYPVLPLEVLTTAFPGLGDGETPVNGGDLVEWLTAIIGGNRV